MFERLEGRAAYSREDEEVQAAFDRLSARYYPYRVTSRIGRAFLRRHRNLLEPLGVEERD